MTEVHLCAEREDPCAILDWDSAFWGVRVAKVQGDSLTDDVPFLQTIAQDIYRDTRFYYDDHFPKDRCRLLYETWITRSCEGYADIVLVAELERMPAGYVTCHLERETFSGSIGLVGASQWAQGRGVGRTLVRDAVDWFATQRIQKVTVVTQGRNYAAQRLYQRCGILSVFHYLPLHSSDMGQRLGGRPGDCPVIEDVSDRLLRLPFYNDLNVLDQERVVSAFHEFSTHRLVRTA
jgi:dTDP-4-amino-4,6-dideoxygalactose transaminase